MEKEENKDKGWRETAILKKANDETLRVIIKWDDKTLRVKIKWTKDETLRCN